MVTDVLAPLLVKNGNLLLLLLLEALSSTSNTSMIDENILHCELRTTHIYLLCDISSPVKTSVLQLFPSNLLGCHKKVRVVYKTVTVLDKKHFFNRFCEFEPVEVLNRDKSKRRF